MCSQERRGSSPLPRTISGIVVLMTKYTRELLVPLAKKNVSVAGVLRDLGLVQVGSIHTHISKLLRKFEIDTTHFTGSATNSGASHTGGPIKKTWREILILTGKDQRVPAFRLRRALIEMGRPYLCQDCQGPPTWNGKELRLQVEHSNGEWTDNRPENLKFLCPNCHSQTPTHSGSTGLTDVTSNARQYRERRRRRSDGNRRARVDKLVKSPGSGPGGPQGH